MSAASNPLFGFPGSNINQPPPPPPGSGVPPTSPVNPTGTASPISTTTPNTNPGNLPNPGSNIKDIQRNAGDINNATGALRNQLIPQFAQLMGKYGGSAADFFTQLMNLGSPYYKQQQTASFNQGVQQNQNAAAQARQQNAAAGTGFTPSGTTAAMIGGMNQSGGESLASQFLQNLFQNENLQAGAGTSLAQIASMFNPSSLFGSVPNPGTTQGPSAGDTFANITKSIADLFSSGNNSSGGGGGGNSNAGGDGV